MWNRVLLLAFGMATGWSLVNYWVAPPAQIRSRVAQFGLSLALGLAVVVWMGMDAVESGVAGVLAFAFCALVAYAANARHIDHVLDAPALPKPTDPLVRDSRLAVVLTADIEPDAYDGPTFWARRFHQATSRGARTPHWFVRPRIYARIRTAYAQMGGHHPVWLVLEQAACALGQRLGGGYLVRVAALYADPTLADALTEWFDLGLTHFALLPLGEELDREALSEQVACSRVRELGVKVQYLAPLSGSSWSLGQPDERLARLAAGHMAQVQPIEPQVLDELCHRITLLEREENSPHHSNATW